MKRVCGYIFVMILGLSMFGGNLIFAVEPIETRPTACNMHTTAEQIAKCKRLENKCLRECDASGKGGKEYCDCKCQKGILLNTDIPFIGRCINKRESLDGTKVTAGNAFPRLMLGLIQVVFAVVIIVGFLAILAGGFMVTMDGAAGTRQKGLDLIKKVILGFLIIGLSGMILNLINPNFFRVETNPGFLFIMDSIK